MYRRELTLFFFVMAVEAIVFAGLLLLLYEKTPEFPVVGSDSKGYFTLTKNLQQHFVFSRSQEPPFIPESFRTPGYPLFAAVLISLTGTAWSVIFLQYIFLGLTAVLVYWIAREYFSENRSLLAALFFAVNPAGLYLASVFLSDILFVFLFVLAVYVFDKALRAEEWDMVRFMLVGCVLGLATLVKPVGQIFLPLFILFFLLRFRARAFRNAFFMIFCFFLIVTPWSLRNKFFFNSWQLSIVPVYNFFIFHGPSIYASQHGLRHDDGLAFFYARLAEIHPESRPGFFTLADAPYLRRVVVDYAQENRNSFFLYYTLKTVPFFVTDGISDVLVQLGFSQLDFNFSDSLGKGDFRGIVGALLHVRAIPLWLGFIIWTAIFFLMVVGSVDSFRKKNRMWFIAFNICIVFSLAVVTGSVTNSRLRYPATPFMFFLALGGLDYILAWKREIVP